MATEGLLNMHLYMHQRHAPVNVTTDASGPSFYTHDIRYFYTVTAPYYNRTAASYINAPEVHTRAATQRTNVHLIYSPTPQHINTWSLFKNFNTDTCP